ncbi:MAG: NTP transferase domain-containing protein, partial [Rhodanobacteraceae bacterium]
MTIEDANPSLVVLAAGIGSRYGDVKQLAGVGPDDEWLLEYAIHDALAAGFDQIVMVIRAVLREPLQQRLAPHLAGRATLRFVEQTVGTIPEGCRVPA